MGFGVWIWVGREGSFLERREGLMAGIGGYWWILGAWWKGPGELMLEREVIVYPGIDMTWFS